MSYKLEHPYTEEERANFIVEYNHNQGLRIEETEQALFALEPWEKIVHGEVIDNTEEYEAQKAKQEAERIAMLNLTAADVERGIYKAKGMDFDDILSLIQTYPQEGLDVKALKIELKANHFYRGNPYVSAIGQLLGFTEEQLNKFFEDGNYEHLLVKTDEELPTDEIVLLEEPTDEGLTNE